nr:unnamed protein product [Callosobruchus analis]
MNILLASKAWKFPIVDHSRDPDGTLEGPTGISLPKKLDKRLGWIAPKYKNYKRFIGAVIRSAKEAIPRGYRKEYVPGWNEHSEQLYNEFVESGDREVGDELLHSLDASRRSKWEDTVQHIDFTRSSRKA